MQTKAPHFNEASKSKTTTCEPLTVLPFCGNGKTGRALIVSCPGNNNLEILLCEASPTG